MGKRGPRPGSTPPEPLEGQRFGQLTVQGFAGRRSHGRAMWHCLCSCGGLATCDGGNLKSGASKTCGRCVANTLDRLAEKYGRPVRVEYRKWHSAKERCKPTAPAETRVNYFDRGIRVCPEWDTDFEAFLAHAGLCPPGFTLDRINNDRGYEPGNVRWISAAEQAANKRNNNVVTHDGITLHISEWARRTGLAVSSISHRLRQGWPVEQALNPNLTWSQTIAYGLELRRQRDANAA